GTATLEAALLRCPMVIAYKVAWLTYWLGRMLVRLSYLGMVNVIADRLVCPEFIQHDATPAALADALEPLLSGTHDRARMLEGLDEVVRSLGQGGAIERAAEVVLEELPSGLISP
ncbi:MAG: lipid-A-disaccharide synthase, partial [Lentisphaerae bacterium]|nr:lipid-A-disaccharide synthase [Lentisphaerota bacterium]